MVRPSSCCKSIFCKAEVMFLHTQARNAERSCEDASGICDASRAETFHLTCSYASHSCYLLSFVDSFVNAFVNSFVDSFVDSFVGSFVDSFVYVRIHPCPSVLFLASISQPFLHFLAQLAKSVRVYLLLSAPWWVVMHAAAITSKMRHNNSGLLLPFTKAWKTFYCMEDATLKK